MYLNIAHIQPTGVKTFLTPSNRILVKAPHIKEVFLNPIKKWDRFQKFCDWRRKMGANELTAEQIEIIFNKF